MSSTFRRALLALTLCGLVPIAIAEEPADPAVQIDFSVLTPAMAGRFQVASGIDFTGFIPPYLAFSRLASGQKSTHLRSLVERERYDRSQGGGIN